MPENVLDSGLGVPRPAAGTSSYELLRTIDYPHELRALDERQLKQLAYELRAFLLESVSQTGGHLSSNLGTVELTIALHYVLDTPHDRIVWDVGHQTYGHKVLTGRREGMNRMRMWRRALRLPAPRGERIRHVRHRAFEHFDQRRARHGGGLASSRA